MLAADASGGAAPCCPSRTWGAVHQLVEDLLLAYWCLQVKPDSPGVKVNYDLVGLAD
jgi:hypothetical protein